MKLLVIMQEENGILCMYMYKKPSRRRQIAKRVVVYTLMTTAVITLVTLLVLFAYGYRLSREEGGIVQTGLVQLGSRPTGATVSINGQALGSRTNTRTTLPAGEYHIAMNRDGYRPWQKSVSVDAASILWLNYTRLIPETLTPESVVELDGISTSAVSPSREFVALSTDATSPQIRIVTINSDTVEESTLEIPTELYASAGDSDTAQHRFTIESWDGDNRHLLVRHTTGEQTSWLVISVRDVAESKNISRLFNIDPSTVAFLPANNRFLYSQSSGGDIRRIDLSNDTLSRVLVSNVHQFEFDEDGTSLVYTTRVLGDGDRAYGYYRHNNEVAVQLGSVMATMNDELHVGLGRYYGESFVSVSLNDHTQVYRGALSRISSSEPVEAVFTAVSELETDDRVTGASLRTAGRFVVLEHEGAFTVYDIELDAQTTTELKNDDGSLSWLERYMVWDDSDGMLRLYEFDGANQNDIVPVTPGQIVTLSPNGRYLYSVSPETEEGYSLQRVRLVL